MAGKEGAWGGSFSVPPLRREDGRRTDRRVCVETERREEARANRELARADE